MKHPSVLLVYRIGWRLGCLSSTVRCLCHAVRLCAADNKVLVAKEGAVPVILAAMQRHAGIAAVQEQACWTLCILAVNGASVCCGACQRCLHLNMLYIGLCIACWIV